MNALTDNKTLKLQDIVRLFVLNWKWFALSVIICLGLAMLYILRTPPVYSRSASLLIEEVGKNGNSLSSELSSFANMGGYTVKSNVNNEMTTIQSPALLAQTVKQLGLDMTYLADGRFHKISLYGNNLPVYVTVKGKAENEPFTFQLSVNKSGAVKISDLTYNGNNYNDAYSGKLGGTVKTPVGDVDVLPGSAYKAGEEVNLEVVHKDLTVSAIQYGAKLKVTLDDQKNTILNLTFQDTNIQRAEDFLNTLISVYNQNWIEDKNKVAIATSQFIGERLKIIEQELGNVDNDIAGYKKENLIPDVNAVSQLYMGQASTANAQILELNNELAMARYLRTFIATQGPSNQLLPSNSGINNAGIERQIEEYNKQLLQRNNMVSTSSTSNPLVKDMDKGLTSMRGAILASIDNQISSLSTQIAGFRGSEAKSNSHIASNPTQAKYLQSVERQQKVKESLYLFLLQKREENELSRTFTANNTRLITPPTGLKTPVAPSKGKILVMAFLIGILIPGGVIMIHENSDNRIRSRADLSQLSIPIIGELPQVAPKGKKLPSFGKKESTNIGFVVKPRSRDLINEAFRVVRTNLEFMLEDSSKNHKVVSTTSLCPNSGKTFVSMNLSVAYSIRDKKTCVIDLDLRKRTSSSYIGQPDRGIAAYLNGSVDDWHDLIVHDPAYPNLDIIPVGSLPPNPSELLLKPRFAKIMDEVRKEYEITFLDCPPVDIVADTTIITQYSDMTLFIIRAGNLDRDALPVVEEFYTAKRFNALGLVLNGISMAKGHYGYAHYGAHSYGYGYGYGEKEKEETSVN